MATTGLGLDAAKSSGLGKMISDQQINDAYTQGLTALAAIGRGQSASVGQSMESQAAASGAQAQADAQAALEERMATGGAVGTALGLAGQQWMKPSAPKAPGYALTHNDAVSLYSDAGYTGGSQ